MLLQIFLVVGSCEVCLEVGFASVTLSHASSSPTQCLLCEERSGLQERARRPAGKGALRAEAEGGGREPQLRGSAGAAARVPSSVLPAPSADLMAFLFKVSKPSRSSPSTVLLLFSSNYFIIVILFTCLMYVLLTSEFKISSFLKCLFLPVI